MFEVFYDGECPLCVREIRMLRRLDRRGRIVVFARGLFMRVGMPTVREIVDNQPSAILRQAQRRGDGIGQHQGHNGGDNRGTGAVT